MAWKAIILDFTIILPVNPQFQVELLKMVHDFIAPVVCLKEVSLVVQAAEDQFRGDSGRTSRQYKEYTMVVTVNDPAF
ncbi:MAG: hypothetical protein U9P36_00805 [Thermodesulfobacteriota bacterium]|nr:hypothetical protein [Thermodesulfobacteriota bacterium]